MPVGKVPAARPATYIEIGTVASETFGASVAPTIEPVAKMTAEFAPVSACAAASRTTLARTRASSALAAATVMSIIDYFYPGTAGREMNRPSIRRTMKCLVYAINQRKRARAMHPREIAAMALIILVSAEYQCEVVGRHLGDIDQREPGAGSELLDVVD